MTTTPTPAATIAKVNSFFTGVGAFGSTPHNYSAKDCYSKIVSAHLKVHTIKPGHITCFFSVKPAISNYYGGMHGGAVAAIAERMAVACARTVVAQDKEIFLGELSISYLSAAPEKADVIVDGSIVRSGKNITVVAIAFKLNNSGKLVFTSQATLYNMPVSKL